MRDRSIEHPSAYSADDAILPDHCCSNPAKTLLSSSPCAVHRHALEPRTAGLASRPRRRLRSAAREPGGTKPRVSPGHEPHCDPHMALGASSRNLGLMLPRDWGAYRPGPVRWNCSVRVSLCMARARLATLRPAAKSRAAAGRHRECGVLDQRLDVVRAGAG
jgi:hypothetical protein